MLGMATVINTLRYARRLKDAGVPSEHAEAMADAISAELESEIATKGDLATASTELKAVIAQLDSSVAIIRWMLGFTLAFVVALTWQAFG